MDATAPLVSFLLPARNEARRILPACVRSLLAQDYPRFEIIAVNDCSTDGTGDILRGLAAEDTRLHVVEGAAPPPGWMGKPWALTQAQEKAAGDWLLLTDADVVFAPTLLSDAVAFARAEGLNALTLSPRHGTNNFWVRALLPAYEWIVCAGLPLVHRDGAGDEKASACGAFFLIRRAALEKVGGFACVQDRVAEDITLARALKGSGCRLAYLRASDRFWTPHYFTGRELLRGWSKNLWTPNLGIVPGLLLAAFLVLLGLGPVLALLSGHALPGGVALFAQVAAFIPAYCGKGRGILPWRAVFAPVALVVAGLLIVGMVARSAAGQGATRWKDRPLFAAAAVKEEG